MSGFDSLDEASGIDASLALIGDVDGNLEFIHELFDDLPDGLDSTNVLRNADQVEMPPVATTRGHRRRQRWLGMDDTNSSSHILSSLDWRQIARQQKKERDVAEEENTKLRKLIDAHARATKKMLKLVQKASLLSSQDMVARPAAACSTIYIGPSADLDCITQELDLLALNADRTLTTSTLATAHSNAFALENRIVKTATGDVFETTVEVSWLLPFDIEIITSTIFANAFKLVTRKGNRHLQTIYDDDHMKIVQAVSRPKEKNGLQFTKHGQLTTRREPPRSDGSQLVLMIATGGFVRDRNMLVSINGGGYILVSAVPGHDSASLGPLSCVRWYRQFRAQPCAAANLTPTEHGKWIQAFAKKSGKKAEKEVAKVTQAMENLLLATQK